MNFLDLPTVRDKATVEVEIAKIESLTRFAAILQY